MLMKVVLPAPLVPIRPTTESFWIAALTAFAAVTAPKRFVNPWASSMAGTFKEGPEPLRQEHDDGEQREPEAHLPSVGREVIGSCVDDSVEQRAGERREHVAGTREDGDENELAGGRPEGHL